jgi:hypothetical protein
MFIVDENESDKQILNRLTSLRKKTTWPSPSATFSLIDRRRLPPLAVVVAKQALIERLRALVTSVWSTSMSLVVALSLHSQVNDDDDDDDWSELSFDDNKDDDDDDDSDDDMNDVDDRPQLQQRLERSLIGALRWLSRHTRQPQQTSTQTTTLADLIVQQWTRLDTTIDSLERGVQLHNAIVDSIINHLKTIVRF